MQRITALMEKQQLYLNSELKLQHVADMLGTNRTYVSDCIKAEKGQNFTQFVNTYRVEQAKQLLTKHPDKKISAVWAESGFATESSFFRIFKAVTGTTPNEWRANVADDREGRA
jgi:YesN/AraC family two-component response regulator